MKKLFFIALLALAAILLVSIVVKGQEKSVNRVEAKPKVVMEEKIMQDDAVLTYDISSLPDSASRLIIVIREYNRQGLVGEMKGEGLRLAERISIRFSPFQSDSIVTVYIRSGHRNGLARDLVLKPVPDAPQTLFLYEKVPFKVSALSLNTFIPLALSGSFWWDSKYKKCRFCEEKELTEENIMKSDYFKHSPHYYIVGVVFTDNTARVIPL